MNKIKKSCKFSGNLCASIKKLDQALKKLDLKKIESVEKQLKSL